MSKIEKNPHKPHDINKDTSLCIGGWYVDGSICDEVVEYYEASERKEPGRFGGNYGHEEGKVDISVKDSTDIYLTGKDIDESKVLRKYFDEVFDILEEFKKLYPASDAVNSYSFYPGFNIKRYTPPSQAFHAWHCERSGNDPRIGRRHLTFLTYLNDVKEGGETEFYHQNLKIRPEKGLTVIFGTDWTARHRGLPAPKETKYIVSGWFAFDDYD